MLLLTIGLFIPILLLVFFRRKTQPIRHRSPYLMLISLICNYHINDIGAFIMSISLNMILYLNRRENNYSSFTCHFYTFNINILHFVLILPYLFRANRLVNVFNLRYFNSNMQKNKLRESYYLKVYSIHIIIYRYYVL